jgi:hypothetical protein
MDITHRMDFYIKHYVSETVPHSIHQACLRVGGGAVQKGLLHTADLSHVNGVPHSETRLMTKKGPI